MDCGFGFLFFFLHLYLKCVSATYLKLTSGSLFKLSLKVSFFLCKAEVITGFYNGTAMKMYGKMYAEHLKD